MNTLNGYSKSTLTDKYVLTASGGHRPLADSEFIVGTQTAATGSWTGVSIDSELYDGKQISYWLPYNGSGNATLNLTLAGGSTTGAVNCYYGGTSRLTTHYGAGNIIRLVYRKNVNIGGTTYTGWWADANYADGNTYTSAWCGTSAGTAAKTASCSNFTLKANSYLHVLVRYSNTAASAITLNVNSLGAKPIYINGTASSSSNYTLPAGTYIVFYDGTNFYFRTDKVLPGTIEVATLATKSEVARYIECPDTRSTTIDPTTLDATKGVSFDFKQKSVTGLEAAYSGIMTFRPYSNASDWSGGPAHLLAFDVNGLHHRTASSATWGNWSDIITTTYYSDKLSGYVTSGTASLSSYWGKLWDVTIALLLNDLDMTFYIHSSYMGVSGLVHLRARRNSSTTDGVTTYSFSCFLKQITGNLSKSNFRLYYNANSGLLLLWCNVAARWGVYNCKVISSTTRVGKELLPITGILYTNSFTTAQTLPTDSYVELTNVREPDYVLVSLHNTNDTEYPLVWSNETNTSNKTSDLLYKSYSDLIYNPKNKRLTVKGSIKTPVLNISSTSLEKHLTFSRGGYNYISAPSGGNISFMVNGKTDCTSANCELIIQDGSLNPGTTNVTALGTDALRWSNIYAHLANLSASQYSILKLTRSGSTNGALITFANNTGVLGHVGMTGTSTNSSLYRYTSDAAVSYTIWDSGNDGAGSGLDADLLDGLHASAFVTLTGSLTITGQKNFNTNTNSVPLILSRSGLNTKECVSIGVDDGTVVFNHIQDEKTANYTFKGTWLDTENSDGSKAGNHAVYFNLGNSDASIKLDTYTVYHTGNLTKLSQLTNDCNFVTGGPYLPLAGGVMNNGAKITFNANSGIEQTTATTSSATRLVQWYKGTSKDPDYTNAATIGWHNMGDTDGAIYLVPHPSNTDPWAGSVGLYIGKNTLKWNNNNLLKAIKSITRSGTTFTYTCLDGTTGTFTQLDNNTTYSFSGGVDKFTVTPSSGSAIDVSVGTLLVNGTYTSHGGEQRPSYIESGKVRWNMMRATTNYFDSAPSSGYCDWMMMDTYTGSDVPYVTMIGVLKSATPHAYIASGAKGDSSGKWAIKTLLDSGNSSVSGGGSSWGSSITVKINGTTKTLTIPAKPTIPTVTDYYWANIKVSSTESTTTTPTFGSTVTLNSTGNVILNLTRTSKSSWRFLNDANLRIQNNYTSDVVDYFDVVKIAYSTGNVTLKGSLTASSSSNTIGIPLVLKNTGWKGGMSTAIDFYNGGSYTVPNARIATKMIGGGASGGTLIFYTLTAHATTNPNPNGLTERMRIGDDGIITITGQIEGSLGGSWIKARDNAVVKQIYTGSNTYLPVVSIKTASGSWSMGTLGNSEKLIVSYDTDENYNANTNSNIAIYFPTSEGTLALTSQIPSLTNYYTKTESDNRFYGATINRTANTVLAAPNGSAGVASFRKLVVADMPDGVFKHLGTENKASVWSWGIVSGTSGWNSTASDRGYRGQYGTNLDISGCSTWYHRFAMCTDGRIEYWHGINTKTLTKLGTIAWTSEIPTKVSQLENDSNFITSRGYIGTTSVQASSGNLALTGINNITTPSYGFTITTPSGNIQIGPQNTSGCHIYTNKDLFYFNKPIYYWDGSSSHVYISEYNYTSYTPILNSSSTHATKSSVIYAPITSGSGGDLLISDGLGSAPVWTSPGNVTVGGASKADKLTVARTIALSGAVTGSASFNGSANITIATSVNHTHSYLVSGSTLSGSSHAEALKTYFTNNKASIPRCSLNTYYSSAMSNGSLYFGYFLSGYDSTPYGGFYVAHYDTPYYVGISYGTFTLHLLAKISDLTWTNITGKPTIPTLYERNIGINGNNWTFSSPYNTATTTIYAPTSAGTSGYVLKSNGSGAPSWIDPSGLSVSYAEQAGSATTAGTAYGLSKSFTVFGVAFNGAIDTTVDMSTLIGVMGSGDSNITDSTHILTSHINGFNSSGNTTTIYKRTANYLWNYIKGKIDSTYTHGASGGYIGTTAVQSTSLTQNLTGIGGITANSTIQTTGSLKGLYVYVNSIYGNTSTGMLISATSSIDLSAGDNALIYISNAMRAIYTTRTTPASLGLSNAPWGALYAASGTFTGNISANGGSFYTNANGAYHTSDIRKKTNITKARNLGIADLLVEFDWKDSDKHSWGYIAQDLLEVLPEAVDYNEDIDVYSVNYNVAHSAAIASLTARIKELEEKLKKYGIL